MRPSVATSTLQTIDQARALLDAVKRDKLHVALEKVGQNRSQTAKLLGISRSTLYQKLKRYRLIE